MSAINNPKTFFIMPDHELSVTPNFIFDMTNFLQRDGHGYIYYARPDGVQLPSYPIDLVIPSEHTFMNIVGISMFGFQMCEFISTALIPEGVTDIQDYAFQGCMGMKSITIPSTVVTIGANVFDGCSKLTTININKPANSITGAPWGATNATINWVG